LYGRRIRVTEEIDRGGMSYVMRGFDTKLLRDLAVKVSPLPRDELPRGQLARFVEEAQITAQLEHPNVVPVHDMGLDPDGRVYFTMKLVRGRSLESILELRRKGDPSTLAEFGLRRLLDVFLQVCQAIEYAHARGVIHRDLKPSNIMVGDFGEVLVMDWGVAKLEGRADLPMTGAVATATAQALADGDEPPATGDSVRPPGTVKSVRAGQDAWATQMGEIIGTPAYMSPEQARAEPIDHRADVYALGVILYEILCGHVPFEDEDPVVILGRLLMEAPKRPSEVDPTTPLALEALTLQMLEKSPERRTLRLAQIRAHIQNYIEGVGREYRRPSLWTNLLWLAGALGLFAFLVWYLTGQSIAALFPLAPPTVLNTVGWFLLVVALGYPLWSISIAFRVGRRQRDRFAPPDADETFVSGYLAHRTLAAALAPLFQLVFILELVGWATARLLSGGELSPAWIMQFTRALRDEWAQSLIVILIFLFVYSFLLWSEVRFARHIDRYELIVHRPRWEAVWPCFLILVLLLTVATTHVLEWSLTGSGNLLAFFQQQILTQSLSVFDIVKTLVFQGTFLMGLVLATVLLAFPFAEVLAALRLAYQPADEAAVAHRSGYFLRSLAMYRVARVNWLYGGAMIGSLTAMTLLSADRREPLVAQVLYILGPWAIGFVGYAATRRHVRKVAAHAPAVARLLEVGAEQSRLEQARTDLSMLERASWQMRALQLVVPLALLAAYLVWTESGLHQRAFQQLILPATTKGLLLILPYVLLVPTLLLRDRLHIKMLRQRLEPPTAQ
jgi:serine/threonine protein kinase